MMKELLEERLEKEKWEMWDILKTLYEDGQEISPDNELSNRVYNLVRRVTDVG